MATREQKLVLAGLLAWLVVTTAWWTLALWPVQDAPAWLERTRYVCFGVNETGLPDGGGWIGLIAGPIGMLLILVVGSWGSVRAIARDARSHMMPRVALLTLITGVLLLGTGAAWRVRTADVSSFDVASGTLAPEAYTRMQRAAPALSLVDQHGNSFDLENVRGRPVLVTFAFAHCETVCPLVVSHALKAQEALRGTPEVPLVVIVTLDPWRDTPARLASMAAAWRVPASDAWILSGAVDDVEKTLDAWHIPRQRDTNNGDITHPAAVYIVDREGRLAFATTGGVDLLTALLRRL
jgi:cytochrome oxidase Cu insertion factor (SCO1/SenC/PrrC family)